MTYDEICRRLREIPVGLARRVNDVLVRRTNQDFWQLRGKVWSDPENCQVAALRLENEEWCRFYRHLEASAVDRECERLGSG